MDEKRVSIDVIIFCCEVDKASKQFSIRDFLELFDDIYATVASLTRTKTKLDHDEFTFIKQ